MKFSKKSRWLLFFCFIGLLNSAFWFGDDAADDESDKAEPVSAESTAGAEEANADDIKAYLSEEALVKSRPWQPPDYSGQDGALGYSNNAFAVPKGMESRVDFWVDIYSKYTTSQGVLHDSRYPEIIYSEIDFKGVEGSKARRKMLKDKKQEIAEVLKRLANAKSAEGLTGWDLEIYQKFEGVDEIDKFKNANKKGRVRFQLGQKDRFIQGIYYSGRYLKQMEEIFRTEGLPIELTRLPFVESSFNIYARSRVGASGIWQFMRRTARYYMHVDGLVDERNDPLHATQASAKLLRSNYQLLEHWPLAVTGYNHGPNGVKRIVQKLKTTDLPDIINRSTANRFGFASENFYACFLAAVRVEQQANRFFGPVKWSETLENQELPLKRALSYKDLLSIFDGNMDMAELYNPHFSRGIRKGRANIPSRTFIRVPAERVAFANSVLEKTKDEVAAPTPLPQLLKVSAVAPRSGTAVVSDGDGKTYRVRRGDSLFEIAREFGVSLNDLRDLNDIPNSRIKPGQILKIP